MLSPLSSSQASSALPTTTFIPKEFSDQVKKWVSSGEASVLFGLAGF
jgi:hypothetical protein